MTVSLDFDGVIHKYSQGYKDGTCYDNPVEGAGDFIKDLFNKGYTVFILSARSSEMIKEWFKVHFPDIETSIIDNDYEFWNCHNLLGITNRKLPAHIYIDDRGFKFEGDFTEMLYEVQNFKTWQNSKI